MKTIFILVLIHAAYTSLEGYIPRKKGNQYYDYDVGIGGTILTFFTVYMVDMLCILLFRWLFL